MSTSSKQALITKQGTDRITVLLTTPEQDTLEENLEEAFDEVELNSLDGEYFIDEVTPRENGYSLSGTLTVDNASEIDDAHEMIKEVLEQLEYTILIG